MKFLISESKLGSILFSYLDNMNLTIKETSDNYYFLRGEDNWKSEIRVVKYFGHCYLSYDFVKEISDFFSIKFDETEKIIGKYVEKKLNVEPRLMVVKGRMEIPTMIVRT